jgi:hypothetical protein
MSGRELGPSGMEHLREERRKHPDKRLALSRRGERADAGLGLEGLAARAMSAQECGAARAAGALRMEANLQARR